MLCAAHAAAAGPKTPPVETELAAGLTRGRSCLKREADDGDRTKCIGVIAKPCGSDPFDRFPSAHAPSCRERQAQAWDRALNEADKHQMVMVQSIDRDDEVLKAKRIETLCVAARLWTQFRDAEMKHMKVNSDRAAARRGLANIEAIGLEMTAKRTIELC